MNQLCHLFSIEDPLELNSYDTRILIQERNLEMTCVYVRIYYKYPELMIPANLCQFLRRSMAAS